MENTNNNEERLNLEQALEKYTDELKSYMGGSTPGSGSSITVDSELSATSTNPVQNSVITTELNKKMNSTAIIKKTFSVLTTSWTDSGNTTYPTRATISFPGVTADDFPDVAFNFSCAATVEAAGVSEFATSIANGVYIYAKVVPSAAVTGLVIITKA